jgi:hypothetical protein
MLAFFLLICFWITAETFIRAENTDLLSIENKYIKIFINNSGEETGRFAVDVTKGDPARDDDDNKPLIYGRPKPWTSFTTIRIDGKNFVFGKATGKRPGAGVLDGEIVEPPKIDNNTLRMKCQYNSIIVTQSLDIVRSPSTGALDTARIKYHIRNEGAVPAEVGLRTLIDTMVGNNDGAPFRMGNQTITSEYRCRGTEIPDFWQAFDSLTQPAVIAQGTLKGGEITPPNRIDFTNWGKAADNPWDFPVEPGQNFLRLEEDELDSAVVMFWEPRMVSPGGEYNVIVYYGLGGITLSPGSTFLGISAPAEVYHNSAQSNTYTVIMYLEHHGENMARNVQIRLILPEGLDCVSKTASITLPELIPEVTKQFSWEIRPNGKFNGETSFQVKVTGDNLVANQVARKIKIIGPPVITGNIIIPVIKVAKNQWEPYPVKISAHLKNLGESNAYHIKATLTGSFGVELAEGESAEKPLISLDGKQETTISWQMTPLHGFDQGKIKILVSGDDISPLALTGEISIPPLQSQLAFSIPEHIKRNRPFSVELIAYNLTGVHQFHINLKYNPEQLQLIHISRGTFLVDGKKLLPWVSGTIDAQNGLVTNIRCYRDTPFTGEKTTLFRLNFIAIGSGEGRIQLEELKLMDAKSIEITNHFTNQKYRIEEE